MGINFYLHINTCDHCGRSEKTLHIGKSSTGWAFLLHVDPTGETCPRNWSEWAALIAKPGERNRVTDEDGREYTLPELVEVVMHRKGATTLETSNNTADGRWFDKSTHLWRVTVDGDRCIETGDGTYDLIVGEFN